MIRGPVGDQKRSDISHIAVDRKVSRMQRDFSAHLDLPRPLYGLCSFQTIGNLPLPSFHLAQEKGCFSVA